MEYDLLFTLIRKEDWKKFTNSGYFKPDGLEENGYVRCYTDDQVESAANQHYSEEDLLFLVIIDPLRLQVPLLKKKIDGVEYPCISGAISLDTIIDRIELKKGKKGTFAVHVKHYD